MNQDEKKPTYSVDMSDICSEEDFNTKVDQLAERIREWDMPADALVKLAAAGLVSLNYVEIMRRILIEHTSDEALRAGVNSDIERDANETFAAQIKAFERLHLAKKKGVNEGKLVASTAGGNARAKKYLAIANEARRLARLKVPQSGRWRSRAEAVRIIRGDVLAFAKTINVTMAQLNLERRIDGYLQDMKDGDTLFAGKQRT